MTQADTASGRKIDPGLRRNLVIIGSVVAVTSVAMVMIVWSRLQAGNTASRAPAGAVVPSSAGVGQAKSEPPSPAMQALLREQQLAEAEAARRTGKLYIPPDSAGLEPVPPPGGVGPAAPAADSRLGVLPGGSQYGVNQGVTANEQAQMERIRRGLDSQLKELVASAAPGRETARIVVAGADVPAGVVAGQAAVSAAPAAASPGQSPSRSVVDALEIFPAITLTPVDTYKTGYFTARIAGGRLAGAFLVGRTQIVNEGLQPRFTQMRWNGKTYAVDAIALDEKSGTDAVEADLDRRYMQRYVMPILVAMAGGYANAKSQTGSTVAIGGNDGLLEISRPAPSEKQAVNAGLSQGMAMTQRAIEREAELPIRASLPAGTAIGVMFNAPVADVDASRDANQAAARAANSARNESMPVQAATPTRAEDPAMLVGPRPLVATPGFGLPSAGQVAAPYGRVVPGVSPVVK